MPGILLVDDDDDMRDAVADLVRFLSGEPCLGLPGLAEVEAQRDAVLACRLAVLDINLGPGRPSGIDVYAWLKRNGFTGRIAFLTGHARNHPLVQRACEIGDAKVWDKPVGIDEVKAMLAEDP